MEIKTLEDSSLAKISAAFNKAFSDYIVRLQLTEEQLKNKIIIENIKLNLSFGAFEDDNLVGFILHGVDRLGDSLVAYNAGTGVIPEYRGRRIPELIYKQAFEVLKKNNIYKHQLEVITSNIKAIKIYKNLGFHISREFNCYKGKLTEEPGTKYNIDVSDSIDLLKASEFWECEPSWQNGSHSIQRLLKNFVILSATDAGQLIGYVIFSKESGRIQQIAVKKEFRKQGIGKALIYKVGLMIDPPEIMLINIDAENKSLNAFLTSIGFVNFINLSEMKLDLSSN